MGKQQGTLETVGRLMQWWELYRGKRVLVTGHTGFKGAWLCRVLQYMGATVTGYALEPPTMPSLFSLLKAADGMRSVTGNICDLEHLLTVFEEARPEIVLHLAAQPIVREGYRAPVLTYATNVMGTVNVLECIKKTDTVRSFLNVTTDKVYLNREWEWGYREYEPLDGYDPYSNSKSCAELVTHSYKNSFFDDGHVAISTARAGNVIGGGDFAPNRIIPDCVRAAMAHEPILVRSPNAIRPYQHVLEPLFAYLMIAALQLENGRYAGYYNVGPDEQDCLTTGALTELFVRAWGEDLTWHTCGENGPHEATLLKLDCAKLKKTFGWKPTWDITEAVTKVVEWSKAYAKGNDVAALTDTQIEEYSKALKEKTGREYAFYGKDRAGGKA